MPEVVTDPDTWGVVAGLLSFPPAFAAYVLCRLRPPPATPDGLALPFAVIASGMSVLGVYTTIIDGDSLVDGLLRLITVAYCVVILAIVVSRRQLARKHGYLARNGY